MAVDLPLSKKQGPTLTELAKFDDVLTDALVDKVYFWTTIRKNRAKYIPSRGIRDDEVATILRETVIQNKDPGKATEQIVAIPGIRRFHRSLNTAEQKENFIRHLRKYVNMYMPDCPWEVTTTNRYIPTEHEAAVAARRDIRKGEVIKYLVGVKVPMTKEEERNLDLSRRDFSIVMSTRKKTPSLFLGPARFANHDCDANARLSTTGLNGMQIVATKNIKRETEITVTYGEDYFGEDNCECLCASCEKAGKGGWLGEAKSSMTELLPLADERQLPEEPYTFRKKRKYAVELEKNSPASSSPSSRESKTSINNALCEDRYSDWKISISQGDEGNSATQDADVTLSKLDTVSQTSSNNIDFQRKSTSNMEKTSATPSGQLVLNCGDLRSTISQNMEKQRNSETNVNENSCIIPAATDLERTLSSTSVDSRFQDPEIEAFAHPSNHNRNPPKQRLRRTYSKLSRQYRSHHSYETLRSPPSSSMEGSMTSNVTEPTSVSDESRSPGLSKVKRADEEDARCAGTGPLSSLGNGGLEAGKHTATELSAVDFEENEKAGQSIACTPDSELSELSDSCEFDDQSKSIVRNCRIRTRARSCNTPVSTPAAALHPPEDGADPKARRPGDYILNPQLLSTIYSRWVECRTCFACFVQEDAYLTRLECPRCERHSKLYGYQWPKTEKEGRGDKEERVMDPRTVHRFVDPQEEKETKKGRKRWRMLAEERNAGVKKEKKRQVNLSDDAIWKTSRFWG